MITPGNSNNRILYAAVGVLLLTCGLLGGLLLGSSRTAAPEPVAVQQRVPARPVANLPPELTQLMRTWMCPCGTCRDALLDCVCDDANGAREVTAYVRGLHAEGVPLEEIRQRAIDRYGATIVGGS